MGQDLERLYGTLELRSTDDELREFSGIANTAALDAHGTIIDPAGARFTLPLPLLWHHDQKTPVGEITEAALVNGQWIVKGTIRKVTEAGRVKDATDEAWHSIKYKLVRGLSIGFKPLKEKGNRFLEWLWRELSLVTIPSNAEASILAVREASLAALGERNNRSTDRVPPSPGVSGNPTKTNNNPRPKKMTNAERIQSLEARRAANVARMDELNQKASDEGRTKDESEQEEFNTLRTEVRSVDTELVDVREMEKLTIRNAVPVNGTSTAAASASRGNVSVKVESRADKGIGFARYAMALATCSGNRYEAAEYVKRTFGESDTNTEVTNALQHRAAISAGTTTDATFAAPLVKTNFLDEFIEMLRPATLIGRIAGLRRVPFNISMPSQTAGGTYNWVGQGAAKPLTNMAFGTVTLGMSKAAGIIVLSEELVRSSAPSAQETVRDELTKGITQFLDGQFIDPAVAAVANVSPASITNGVAGTAASGTTEAAARSDLRALLGGFVTGNFGLGGVVLLMNEGVAFTLGSLVNAVGEPAYPGMTATGGSLLGIQVVTSNTIGDQIIAVHAPSVLVADDGGVDVAVSRDASLQMDSAPSNPTDATTVMVSLFQRNLVALRGERFINWGVARTGAVRRTHTVAYA